MAFELTLLSLFMDGVSRAAPMVFKLISVLKPPEPCQTTTVSSPLYQTSVCDVVVGFIFSDY